MIKLFVDPQGNAQILTDFLAECQAKEPDVFIVAECTEEQYELIKQGYLWLNGKPTEPPKPPEPTLDEIKEQAKERIKATYAEIKKRIREEREELELIDEDTAEKTKELKEAVIKERELLNKVDECKTVQEVTAIDSN